MLWRLAHWLRGLRCLGIGHLPADDNFRWSGHRYYHCPRCGQWRKTRG